MRKSHIITVTAALLLCAVLCTAGCVNTDPIVGTWAAEDDTFASYAVFEQGGTGYFTAAAEKDGTAGSVAAAFTWTKNTDGSYTAVLADKTTVTATLDAQSRILTTDDETVYVMVPDGLGWNLLKQIMQAGMSEAPETMVPGMIPWS